MMEDTLGLIAFGMGAFVFGFAVATFLFTLLVGLAL